MSVRRLQSTGANWPDYEPEIQATLLAGQYWIKVVPSAVMGATNHGDLGQYVLEAWR